MEATFDIRVADMVTKNIKTADVFKKHGIDFCCGGGVSITKACEKNNVDQKTLESELAAILNEKNESLAYDSWELVKLVDHIEETHHVYVREAIPLIIAYSDKVAKVHGAHYTEQVDVNELFHQLANELVPHLLKEEQVLFPYIRHLSQANEHGNSAEKPHFGSVVNPIAMMRHDHDDAGEMLRSIREKTNNFKLPLDACNTFRALYHKLEEFEADLHLHVHLENNLVFPKAEALEAEMTANND